MIDGDIVLFNRQPSLHKLSIMSHYVSHQWRERLDSIVVDWLTTKLIECYWIDDGWMDEWKDGWMDGWKDGWMDGWMDE